VGYSSSPQLYAGQGQGLLHDIAAQTTEEHLSSAHEQALVAWVAAQLDEADQLRINAGRRFWRLG
jgi:hypothetical protein